MTVNGVELTAVLAAVLATTLLRATPLVLAAVGEAIAERAGMLNLGIEGMMIAGCFFGFWVAERTGNLWLGLLVATLAGAILGAIFAGAAVWARAEQVLTGLAITIIGLGLTGFLFRDVYGGSNVAADVSPPRLSIPVLRDLPVVGPALFDQQLVLWLCWLAVPVTAWLLARTRFGLRVRAAGEAPAALDAAGVNVLRLRTSAMLLAGSLAGLAGGFLCVADVRIFSVGMTVGQGFIALAIAMIGGWRPWRIALAALLFGLLRSIGDALQLLGVDVQTEFVNIVPYLGIMLALVVLARRAEMPAALGVPYRRGER